MVGFISQHRSGRLSLAGQRVVLIALLPNSKTTF